MILRIFFLIICCLVGVTLRAQSPEMNVAKEMRMLNRWEIYLTPFLSQKADISYDGLKHLQAGKAFAVEAGVNFIHPVSEMFSLEIGASLGQLPLKVEYDFETTLTEEDVINTQHKDVFTDHSQLLVSIPVGIQYKFISKPNSEYFIGTGVAVNFPFGPESSFEAGYGVPDEPYRTVPLFEMHLRNAENTVPLIPYLKIGGRKFWKDGKNLNLVLVWKYGLFPVREGEYTFMNLREKSYGTVEISSGFLGLQLAYGFISRRLRRDLGL